MKSNIPKIVRFIAEAVGEYMALLHLGGYAISIKKTELDDKDALFEIVTNAPYRDAEIRYYAKAEKLFRADKQELKKAVLHELLHIITAKLKRKAEERYVNEKELGDEEESLVDWLTEIIFPLTED